MSVSTTQTTMRQGSIRASLKKRGHDLYETPECAITALIDTGALKNFSVIFEPCAGRGAIVRVLRKYHYTVLAHELVDYPGRDAGIYTGIDFFKSKQLFWAEAIVTNPPFKDADRFIRHGLKLGVPVIVLMRLMALEGARRADLIDEHLRHVFIGKERLPMMHRDGWSGRKLKQAAMPFGWFVFLPGKRESDMFTASRISWRGEGEDGLDVDPGPHRRAIAAPGSPRRGDRQAEGQD